MGKDEFYKRTKIFGMLLWIPMILAAGPVAGYFIGDFLGKKFGHELYFVIGCISIGIAVSVFDVVVIIRKVSKIDEDR